MRRLMRSLCCSTAVFQRACRGYTMQLICLIFVLRCSTAVFLCARCVYTMQLAALAIRGQMSAHSLATGPAIAEPAHAKVNALA